MNMITHLDRPLRRTARIMTLAALRADILADPELPAGRRAKMASAIKTIGKGLRSPLEALDASPLVLRPLLAKVTPAMVGITAGSWRNARSLLGAALDHINGGIVPGRFDLAPTSAWVECLQLLPKEPMSRFVLARFARYATVRRVEPLDVDDTFLIGYQHDLVYNCLNKEPLRVARDTARVWNRAAEANPGWPQRRLLVADNRKHYSRPWGDFPASLLEEIERWLDWLGRDPFADRDFRALRPSSILNRQKQLALFLGALADTGVNLSEMTNLAAVVTVQHAKAGLQLIYNRDGKKLSGNLANIADVLVVLARHWVRLEGEPLRAIQRLGKQMRPDDHDGLAPRNEKRLAQIRDDHALDDLLNLPVRLAQKIARAGAPTISLARLYQTAVVIELFIMTGMRIANVAGLEIGRTLILRGDGGINIIIPRNEVKNRVALNSELPDCSAKMVHRYIEIYRPLLGAPNSAWLFPGSKPGTRKTTDALRTQVSLAIGQHCGLQWHPHLFRHLLAYMVLAENPGSGGIVTSALGHKRPDTTRKNYEGFQNTAAIKHHDNGVLQRRALTMPGRGRRQR